MTNSTTVKVSTLDLGDIVRLEGMAFEYSTATVYRVNPDGSRQVWRPYVRTSEFSYTGGLVPYVGIEDFALLPENTVTLLRKATKPL